MMDTSHRSYRSGSQAAIDIELVGACYYLPPAAIAEGLRTMAAEFARRGHRVTIRAIAMKAPLPKVQEAVPVVHWHSSSGSFLDISAYHSGLGAMAPDVCCILLNDTLFTRHPWRRITVHLANLLPALAATPVAAAAGEVHPSTDLLLADAANPGRRHLSTFCFALNSTARTVFADIVATLPSDGSTATAQAWLDLQTARYPALHRLLYVHLLAPDNPWTWKRLSHPVPSELVVRKAVTVAIEYLLTVRLLESQGLVMPINLHPSYKLAARFAAWRSWATVAG